MSPEQALPPAPASSAGSLPQHLLQTMPWAVLALDRQGHLLLANPQAEQLLGRSTAELLGRPLATALGAGFPATLREALAQAATASEPVTGEFFLPHCQQWIEMTTAPDAAEVLVYWQDVTRTVAQRQQYQALADNSPDAIARWDTGLRLLYANPALATTIGRPVAELLGKTAAGMGSPAAINGPYEAKVRQVFETGQPADHYNTFLTPQGERQFHSRLVPEVHDGQVYTVLSVARDLTDLQAVEAELRAANGLLRSVLDAPNVGLSAYQAVRDATGTIQDFEYRLVSGGDGPADGEPSLVGRRLLETSPARHSCFVRMRQVVETGVADTYEVLAPDGMWYLNSNARWGDGFVNVWTDITAHKQLEQAQRESQRLLQAIFDTTLNSLEVLRSVRDEAGRVVDFEWLLANQAAHRLVQRPDFVGKRMLAEEPHLQTSGVFDRLRTVVEQQQATDFEQYYPYDGSTEWYHVSAAPLGDGLVVTWQSITVGKQATADLLALQRTQQQQLANAVLETQETERGRIAESLHNGLGQLLYAVQLHLASLMPTDSAAAFAEGKLRTTELLQTAISKVRTLSHQLTPTVLADFGLAVVIRGICQDFSTPKLHLHCAADDLGPVPPALALPLYRMAQELVTNVARHADATEAHLHLREHDGWLELLADDNGRGFDTERPRPPGLGLNGLRDRIQLLNGELTVESSPERGTHIRIRLPRTVPPA